MKTSTLQQARIIAKTHGYDDVKYRGKWNGYEVFAPIYNDNEIRFTGYPHIFYVTATKFAGQKIVKKVWQY